MDYIKNYISIQSLYDDIYYDSGTRVRNLVDNPCASRSKDGIALLADYPNAQCFARKNLISNKYYRLKHCKGSPTDSYNRLKYSKCDVLSNWYKRHINNFKSDKCLYAWTTILPNQFYFSTSSWDDGDHSYTTTIKAKCVLKTDYLTNIGWNKINNTQQEYREDF